MSYVTVESIIIAHWDYYFEILNSYEFQRSCHKNSDLSIKEMVYTNRLSVWLGLSQRTSTQKLYTLLINELSDFFLRYM